jgi:hypothetical protein
MAELIGQGPVGLPGGTSVVFTTPFPLQLGSRAKDVAGNEYIFCTFGNDVNAKMCVQIDSAFDATIIGVAARGPLGVVCATNASSDSAGWVQIYGKAMMMIVGAGSGGTQPSPSDAAAGPTTLSTSAATKFQFGTSLTSPHALTAVNVLVSTSSGIFAEGISVAQDADPAAVTAVCNTTNSSARHTGEQISVWLNYPVAVYRNIGE